MRFSNPAQVAALEIDLYASSPTRDCAIAVRYAPRAPDSPANLAEMWQVMTTCLYLESQMAISPIEIRSALLERVKTLLEKSKPAAVIPPDQASPPDGAKTVEMKIELLAANGFAIASRPKFLKVKGQPAANPWALIGLMLHDLIDWPLTQTGPEGQTAYLMLLDIAADRWQKQWPGKSGGTWGKWSEQEIISQGDALGWHADLVWAAWILEMASPGTAAHAASASNILAFSSPLKIHRRDRSDRRENPQKFGVRLAVP